MEFSFQNTLGNIKDFRKVLQEQRPDIFKTKSYDNSYKYYFYDRPELRIQERKYATNRQDHLDDFISFEKFGNVYERNKNNFDIKDDDKKFDFIKKLSIFYDMFPKNGDENNSILRKNVNNLIDKKDYYNAERIMDEEVSKTLYGQYQNSLEDFNKKLEKKQTESGPLSRFYNNLMGETISDRYGKKMYNAYGIDKIEEYNRFLNKNTIENTGGKILKQIYDNDNVKNNFNTYYDKIEKQNAGDVVYAMNLHKHPMPDEIREEMKKKFLTWSQTYGEEKAMEYLRDEYQQWFYNDWDKKSRVFNNIANTGLTAGAMASSAFISTLALPFEIVGMMNGNLYNKDSWINHVAQYAQNLSNTGVFLPKNQKELIEYGANRWDIVGKANSEEKLFSNANMSADIASFGFTVGTMGGAGVMEAFGSLFAKQFPKVAKKIVDKTVKNSAKREAAKELYKKVSSATKKAVPYMNPIYQGTSEGIIESMSTYNTFMDNMKYVDNDYDSAYLNIQTDALDLDSKIDLLIEINNYKNARLNADNNVENALNANNNSNKLVEDIHNLTLEDSKKDGNKSLSQYIDFGDKEIQILIKNFLSSRGLNTDFKNNAELNNRYTKEQQAVEKAAEAASVNNFILNSAINGALNVSLKAFWHAPKLEEIRNAKRISSLDDKVKQSDKNSLKNVKARKKTVLYDLKGPVKQLLGESLEEGLQNISDKMSQALGYSYFEDYYKQFDAEQAFDGNFWKGVRTAVTAGISNIFTKETLMSAVAGAVGTFVGGINAGMKNGNGANVYGLSLGKNKNFKIGFQGGWLDIIDAVRNGSRKASNAENKIIADAMNFYFADKDNLDKVLKLSNVRESLQNFVENINEDAVADAAIDKVRSFVGFVDLLNGIKDSAVGEGYIDALKTIANITDEQMSEQLKEGTDIYNEVMDACTTVYQLDNRDQIKNDDNFIKSFENLRTNAKQIIDALEGDKGIAAKLENLNRKYGNSLSEMTKNALVTEQLAVEYMENEKDFSGNINELKNRVKEYTATDEYKSKFENIATPNDSEKTILKKYGSKENMESVKKQIEKEIESLKEKKKEFKEVVTTLENKRNEIRKKGYFEQEVTDENNKKTVQRNKYSRKEINAINNNVESFKKTMSQSISQLDDKIKKAEDEIKSIDELKKQRNENQSNVETISENEDIAITPEELLEMDSEDLQELFDKYKKKPDIFSVKQQESFETLLTIYDEKQDKLNDSLNGFLSDYNKYKSIKDSNKNTLDILENNAAIAEMLNRHYINTYNKKYVATKHRELLLSNQDDTIEKFKEKFKEFEDSEATLENEKMIILRELSRQSNGNNNYRRIQLSENARSAILKAIKSIQTYKDFSDTVKENVDSAFSKIFDSIDIENIDTTFTKDSEYNSINTAILNAIGNTDNVNNILKDFTETLRGQVVSLITQVLKTDKERQTVLNPTSETKKVEKPDDSVKMPDAKEEVNKNKEALLNILKNANRDTLLDEMNDSEQSLIFSILRNNTEIATSGIIDLLHKCYQEGFEKNNNKEENSNISFKQAIIDHKSEFEPMSNGSRILSIIQNQDWWKNINIQIDNPTDDSDNSITLKSPNADSDDEDNDAVKLTKDAIEVDIPDISNISGFDGWKDKIEALGTDEYLKEHLSILSDNEKKKEVVFIVDHGFAKSIKERMGAKYDERKHLPIFVAVKDTSIDKDKRNYGDYMVISYIPGSENDNYNGYGFFETLRNKYVDSKENKTDDNAIESNYTIISENNEPIRSFIHRVKLKVDTENPISKNKIKQTSVLELAFDESDTDNLRYNNETGTVTIGDEKYTIKELEEESGIGGDILQRFILLKDGALKTIYEKCINLARRISYDDESKSRLLDGEILLARKSIEKVRNREGNLLKELIRSYSSEKKDETFTEIINFTRQTAKLYNNIITAINNYKDGEDVVIDPMHNAIYSTNFKLVLTKEGDDYILKVILLEGDILLESLKLNLETRDIESKNITVITNYPSILNSLLLRHTQEGEVSPFVLQISDNLYKQIGNLLESIMEKKTLEEKSKAYKELDAAQKLNIEDVLGNILDGLLYPTSKVKLTNVGFTISKNNSNISNQKTAEDNKQDENDSSVGDSTNNNADMTQPISGDDNNNDATIDSNSTDNENAFKDIFDIFISTKSELIESKSKRQEVSITNNIINNLKEQPDEDKSRFINFIVSYMTNNNKLALNTIIQNKSIREQFFKSIKEIDDVEKWKQDVSNAYNTYLAKEAIKSNIETIDNIDKNCN